MKAIKNVKFILRNKSSGLHESFLPVARYVNPAKLLTWANNKTWIHDASQGKK